MIEQARSHDGLDGRVPIGMAHQIDEKEKRRGVGKRGKTRTGNELAQATSIAVMAQERVALTVAVDEILILGADDDVDERIEFRPYHGHGRPHRRPDLNDQRQYDQNARNGRDERRQAESPPLGPISH